MLSGPQDIERAAQPLQAAFWLAKPALQGCCAVGQSLGHSSTQLSPWGQGRWHHSIQCKLWRWRKDQNQHLSRFAKFQVLTLHSQWFLFLKTAIGGSSVGWRSQPHGVSNGEFYASGRWLLEQRRPHRWQPSGWTDCYLSPDSIPLLPLLEVRDPLWLLHFLKVQK